MRKAEKLELIKFIREIRAHWSVTRLNEMTLGEYTQMTSDMNKWIDRLTEDVNAKDIR